MSSRVITLPNFLTVIRMMLIPVFVTLLVYQRFGWALFVFIAGAAAINIVTGFRGFRPSLLGKASTVVQICAIILVLVAVHVPWVSGYVLPTVYAIVFLLAIASGIHYIFHASRLLNEKQASTPES